jgi:hypothetical protein
MVNALPQAGYARSLDLIQREIWHINIQKRSGRKSLLKYMSGCAESDLGSFGKTEILAGDDRYGKRGNSEQYSFHSSRHGS